MTTHAFPAGRADDSRSATRRLLYLALFVVVLVPIVLTRTLPLDDYMNHIARMYVLAHHDHVPALQKVFEPRWSLLPNLAMELVIVPLARVMSVFLAGKLFVAASFVALVAGTALVHRALSGRWSLWPLAAFLLLYNDTFLYGFQSYIMSVGLALLLFALWIALRDRAPGLRLLAALAGATLLYLCHLTGFGLYALLVFGFEASRTVARDRAPAPRLVRDWLLAGLPFVVPAILFVFFSPTAEAAARSTWGDLVDKWHYFQKAELLFDVFRNYHPWLDRASFALVVLAVAAGLALRRLRFLRHGLGPFLVVAIVFAFLPKMLFSSDFVDDRLAVALAFVFVATVDWHGLAPRLRTIAVAAIAALVVVRVGALFSTWTAYDRDYTAYLGALEAMPEGSVLGAAIAYRGTSWDRRRPPLYHFPNLATITRHAFYPSVFAQRAQQPLALAPAYQAIADRHRRDLIIRTGGPRGADPLAADPFRFDRLADFDYLLVIRGRLFDAPLPAFLAPVALGEGYGLYRVDRAR